VDPPVLLPPDFFGPGSDPVDTIVQRTHRVFDPTNDDQPLPWSATAPVEIELVALSLQSTDPLSIPGPTALGMEGDDLVVQVDLSQVPNPIVQDQQVVGFHPSLVGVIQVDNPSSFNPRVYLPVALRKTEIPKSPITNYVAKITRNFKKVSKDSVKVTTKLPSDPGIDLTGKTVIVTLGGESFTFTLDKKGKGTPVPDPTPVKHKLKVTHNKRKGGLAINFQLKKTVLDFLEDEGITNETIGKPGEPRTIAFQVGICDRSFSVDLTVMYKSKIDKVGTAKGKVKEPK
jgi:hypothetical protein